MNKTKKKASWQTIAVVVLALLLALAITLTATGAWFQDSKQETDTGITLGNKVLIELKGDAAGAGDVVNYSDRYVSTTAALPGDELISDVYVTYGAISNAVLKVGIVWSVTCDNEDQKTIIETALEDGFDEAVTGTGFQAATTEARTYFYKQLIGPAAGNVKIISAVEIPDELVNDASGASITYTINVSAMQAANFAEVGAGWTDEVGYADGITGTYAEGSTGAAIKAYELTRLK